MEKRIECCGCVGRVRRIAQMDTQEKDATRSRRGYLLMSTGNQNRGQQKEEFFVEKIMINYSIYL